jgi:hypothetical protein
MSGTNSVDMAPFLQRHDRITRQTFIGMMSVSLVLSVAIYARFRVNAEVLPAMPLLPPPFLMLPILVSPFSIAALWIAGKLYGRTRPPALPDGSFPMGVDDAINVKRVADAGAVFVTGYGLVMIAIQVFWALRMFGVVQPTDPSATVPAFRAALLAIGALMIYFGNVGPRMPTPRAAEAKPAVRMKYNRLGGWFTVILGLLLFAIALFAPSHKLIDAVGGLGFAVLAAWGVGFLMYRRELAAPIA